MTRDDSASRAAGRPDILEVVEERLASGKRRIVTGRVRVGTHTDTIDETIHEDLETTHAEIERVPIDRILAPEERPPVPRLEGAVTIIPVFEEVLVVERRLNLKEEIRVTTQASVETIEETVTLRRQKAVVERLPGQTDTPPDTTETE
ncbi:YsnF/AvaK domain-containing protein [uncultured Jannaschia sp.]|uniref:YsnF/AvaK domain-containing protein n=1 Tax=uncultured Jannaschia sp. TaxID=293347 RepID=UPI002615E9F3|nr:YsnF/AvaK domain-containing protein [uncultured Jannaschia sp.]